MPDLKRSIGLGPLIFYGLGTMVGAGFYALVGRVAGLAGMSAPISLAFSGMLALLSAASFAELSSRFPVSAGEVRYVEEGFGHRTLAIAVGWLVITTGVVSAATLSVATVGFTRAMVEVPETLGIIAVVVGLGAVAAVGIGESVVFVAIISIVEIGALVAAAYLASGSLAALPTRWPELLPVMTSDAWVGVFSGSFLAFYAFIGFEDLVNLAEEVRRPHRALPIALFVGVTATTLLYIGVSTIAVLAIPPTELAASASPVALLVRDYGPPAMTTLGVVSILAGVNGALVQIIMAARVAYGMARRGQAPARLGDVHPRTRTPVVATALMTLVIGVLACVFPLATLARTTSAVILVIFALVNLALWRVKQMNPDRDGPGPRLPAGLPLLGASVCVGVLLFQGWTVLAGLR